MKFVARVFMEFEADTEEAAQEALLDQVQKGFKNNCAIELARLPTEEEKETQQGISFKDMLNNLNSKDMTKN